MNNNLIVILGPTGIGKTEIAIKLAVHFNCEIISADSRQFYREMRIGTAVPDEGQLNQIRHHFIRFLPVDRYYSASLFERDAMEVLDHIFKKSSVAIMAGGSGLYIDALCNGIDDIPDVEQEIRDKYNMLYKEYGTEGLRNALRLMDPDHYSRVDLRNPKRIIRALEICESTGRPYSSFLKKEKRERNFRIVKIGLKTDRASLYEKINSRVDKMISDGLEDEARNLYDKRNLNALNTVGYKELFDYFSGKTTLGKAVELIKRNSRRYAKRQMTWWAKDKEITWFSPEDTEEIIRFAGQNVSGRIL